MKIFDWLNRKPAVSVKTEYSIEPQPAVSYSANEAFEMAQKFLIEENERLLATDDKYINKLMLKILETSKYGGTWYPIKEYRYCVSDNFFRRLLDLGYTISDCTTKCGSETTLIPGGALSWDKITLPK